MHCARKIQMGNAGNTSRQAAKRTRAMKHNQRWTSSIPQSLFWQHKRDTQRNEAAPGRLLVKQRRQSPWIDFLFHSSEDNIGRVRKIVKDASTDALGFNPSASKGKEQNQLYMVWLAGRHPKIFPKKKSLTLLTSSSELCMVPLNAGSPKDSPWFVCPLCWVSLQRWFLLTVSDDRGPRDVYNSP